VGSVGLRITAASPRPRPPARSVPDKCEMPRQPPLSALIGGKLPTGGAG
jgi:hypothetical protein